MTVQFHELIPMVTYPNQEIIATLKRFPKNGSVALNQYLDFIAETNLTKLQEKFTQTFDMNPDTCLDLGWHLYGEAYERGAFMLKIRELLREQGIAESSELPDHLTHVLAVLDGLCEADCYEFVKKYIQPVLAKILDGFKDSDNSYKDAIQFMDGLFKEYFGDKNGDA